jgi:hypothetical protein
MEDQSNLVSKFIKTQNLNEIMKKYFSYLFIAALIATPFGCGKFGDDLTHNPNGSEVPLTPTLLTNSLSALGLSQLGGGESSSYLYSSYYVQYSTQALYTESSRYALVDPGWNLYSGRVEDLQNIIDTNTDPATAEYAARTGGSNNNQIALARIVKAYWMSIITDRFGDIPYSEANKGIPNPKFDTQESIYEDILNELKTAPTQFDNGAPVIGDIIFNGDAAKWTKFANSWRLILALRLSKAKPATGQTHFRDVIDNLGNNGGVFEALDGSDDMTIVYPGSTAGFQNPWLPVGSDQGVTTTLADFMNNTADDRKNEFGNVKSGTLTGVPPGLPRQDVLDYKNANPNWSLVMNDSYRLDTSPLTLLCAGDVWLARAEGAKLGWISESVATDYVNGITESWVRWGADGTKLAGYLSKPEVALGSGTYSDDEKIGIQRWLSFFPNGDQGWSEWRRTGYPSFVKPVTSPLNTSGQIPVRYIYPTGEHTLNPDNWAAAVQTLDNGDTPDSHVWWDK